MAKRVYKHITDRQIEAVADFADGMVKVIWDRDVRGLVVRIGKHRTTWVFQREHAIRGKRGVTFVRLGYFPEMRVVGARKAAMIEAGRVASGRVIPGRKSATKLTEALDDYARRARVRGKSGSWARNIESLKRTHLKDFLNWTLPELSAAPKVVNDWHVRVTEDHGPYIANQAARVLRAVYNRARQLDRSLPPHNPCSAVEYNKEHRSQVALSFGDFPNWKSAWDKIKTPSRKALQMTGLLCGIRPGELSRLRWSDLFPKHPESGKPMRRTFLIRDAKAKNNIYVPLSRAIARELKRARDASDGSDWVFPGRTKGSHITSFDDDGLPAHGMMYRRTWRTVAADCSVEELIADFCLGHVPKGISRGYVQKLTLASGQAMRRAQRDISRRMLDLFEARS